MLKRYRLVFLLLLHLGTLLSFHNMFAQCNISNLNTSYCLTNPSFTLTGGSTGYYGPGVSGSTFNPSSIGVAGTYTIATTDGNTSIYNVVTSGAFNPITLSSSTVLTLLDGANTVVNFPAGFNFSFFGSSRSFVRIYDNGFVRFSGTANNAVAQLIPDVTNPDDLIAFAWDDLNPSTGTIEYGIVGTAPTRVFVINYTNVQFSTTPAEYVTSQMQLHESSNIIEIHSTHIGTSGANKTMGIENGNGTVAFAVSGRNNSLWTADNDFVSFVPSCSEKRSVVIYGIPTNISAFPASASVCVGGTVSVTIGGSESGVEYQLRDDSNDAPLSAYVAGTGSNLVIASNALTSGITSIKVYARNATTLCGRDLTNKVSVTIGSATSISTQPDPSLAPVCEGGGAAFNVAASGTGLSYQWIKDGIDIAGATSNVYSIPATSTADAGSYTVKITGNPCTTPVISNASVLTIYEKPEITVNLSATATACVGQSQSFTINPGSTSSPTYQWRKGSVNISGAVSQSYTIPSVVSGNAGDYDVIVSSGVGCASPVTSTKSTLTVRTLPAIGTQPTASFSVCEGATANFLVAATGTGRTYQWKKNGIDIGGATSATYKIFNAATADAGTYTVVVKGTCNAVGITSNASVLSINEKPEITGNLSATATACVGQSQSFTVSPGATSSPTYQWRKGGVNISGETNQSYVINSVASADAGDYDVIVSSGVGCASPVTSVKSTLSLNTTPVISTQPTASFSVCEGTTAHFEVAAIGSGLAFQWKKNGIDIGGATSYTYDIFNAVTADAGTYTVVVKGTCNAVGITSNASVLSINEKPEITTDLSATATACVGQSKTFTIAPGLTTSATYQWRKGGVNIASAVSQSYTIPSVASADAGDYDVVVSSGVGCSSPVTSATSTLTVNTPPTTTALPETICNGQSTNITIGNPNNVSGTSYAWTIQSSNNVTGQSAGFGSSITQALTLTNSVIPGSVTYQIIASAAGCDGPPFAVTVTVNPIPVATASDKSICSGSGTNLTINNANSVANTTFSWTVTSFNVAGASSGNGSIINQTLTTTNGGYAIYAVTPSANGCPGSPINVRVDVDPAPVITNAASTLIQEICSGTSLNFTPTASIITTSYDWTSSVVGLLTGVTSVGTNNITDTPISGDNNTAVIIYTITPKNAGCFGPAKNLVVTVRPRPNAMASGQSICSGGSTSVSITNPNLVSGTTYSWSFLGTSINVSGGSSATGNLIAQTLLSVDGQTLGIANYQITPSANGCSGTPINVSVNVKPVSFITTSSALLSPQICSGQVLNFTPAASISGSNFTWNSTVASSEPIDGSTVTASGSNAIPDGPVNTGSANGIVTYHITPHFNACAGPTVDYVVTVKPVPTAAGNSIIICSGDLAVIDITSAPKNVSGTTYSWTTSSSSNAAGMADGNGSRISQTLTTTDALLGTVVYHVIPTVAGCNGLQKDLSATINPIASVNAGADYSVCEPATIMLTGTIGGSATTGVWSIVAGNGLGSLSISSTVGNTVSATYTVNSGDIGKTVKLRLTTNDPDLTGPCSLASDDLSIDIHQKATVTVPSNYTECEPTKIDLTGTLGGSARSGIWTVLSGGGTLTVSSVIGNVVNATYYPVTADVTQTVKFRLTTDDPDGAGVTNPCDQVYADLSILINESAKVNAGFDFEVCEDKTISLNGSFSGTTYTVVWSGGSGALQFSNTSDPLSTYTLTAADIAAGEIVFTLKGNDPDGSGPCGQISDDVHVKINLLPKPVIVGLNAAYAENDIPEILIGFPDAQNGHVGTFSGPGILAGTSIFDPSNADIGFDTIHYSALNSVTGCIGYTSAITVVNPLTDINFGVLPFGQTTPDFSSYPVICNTNGKARLIGSPDPSTTPYAAFFYSPTPAILGSDALGQFINTDGLLSGEYYVVYSYTNPQNAKTLQVKNITVNASPVAMIGAINSCIRDSVSFTDLSIIPDNTNEGIIDSWLWDFDYGNIKKTLQNPKMKYDQEGFYDVVLTVTTDQNCSANTVKQIFMGTTPTVDFDWSKICSGQATTFKDKSTINLGAIKGYSWDFGDGYVLDFGLANDPIPVGTHDGNTSHTYKDPEHKYQDFKEYNVTLNVTTDVGCTDSKTKRIYILDYKAPTAISRYFEDFEGAQPTWVKSSVAESSWVLGLPDGNEINKASSGTNAWWTGANPDALTTGSTYLNEESSEVIGPCLDISSLERPMISLDYWTDAQNGYDGAVMQYSFDGGVNWLTLGNSDGDEGINWYNTHDLTGSQPGGQDNFAWSDTLGGWKNARFNLDRIPFNKRDTLVFRIAFGSDVTNRFDRVFNGFAFDNIYIGEKKRNVLVEHFTNTPDAAVAYPAAEYLDNLYDRQTSNAEVTFKEKSDFTKIQYHLGSPLSDPINEENSSDTKARAVYYEVVLPPFTAMDGISRSFFGEILNGDHKKITPNALDRRALEDPLFGIKVDTFQTDNQNLKANIKLKYIDSVNVLSNSVVVHAVLIESNVGANRNVVRKLLPEIEGVLFASPWNLQRDTIIVPIDYTIDVPIANPDNLSLVVFVQDKITQMIHQSTVVKIQRKLGREIVGLPDDPKSAEINDIRIYPNPAKGIVNLELDHKINHDYEWQFIDQRGITILSGKLNHDLTSPQKVNISELASGVYFVKLSAKNGTPLYRKVVVIN